MIFARSESFIPLLTMRVFTVISLHYILLLLLTEATSLKCRTGKSESDDQIRKIMQTCRKRFNGYRGTAEEDSSESDDSEDSSGSDDDLYDPKFLSRNNGQGGGYNFGARNRSNNGSQYYQNGSQRNNGTSYSGNSSGRRNDNRNSFNRSGSSGINESGTNPNHERERSCVVQCFFNELNMVDQRGFPEKSPVIAIMTENIHDMELKDFVEEAITECFHFLNSDTRKEKCSFSQNLLTCLAEKGREGCEDWDL